MNPKALIFDSGIGGFSVFKHIRQTLPGLDSCYLMDNALFPYGIQPDDILIERIVSLCETQCARLNINILIIACNTASTLALPALREKLNIPIVGVVPAIKTAAALSQSRHIALLATPATIDRPYTDKLVMNHADHCKVTRIGSSELVKLAENFWFHNELDEAALANILSTLVKSDIDQMVLGCTHFPIINEHISRLFPHIHLVDSGEAIARRVDVVLQELGFQPPQLNLFSDNHTLLTTAPIIDKQNFLTACQRIAPYQSFDIV